ASHDDFPARYSTWFTNRRDGVRRDRSGSRIDSECLAWPAGARSMSSDARSGFPCRGLSRRIGAARASVQTSLGTSLERREVVQQIRGLLGGQATEQQIGHERLFLRRKHCDLGDREPELLVLGIP